MNQVFSRAIKYQGKGFKHFLKFESNQQLKGFFHGFIISKLLYLKMNELRDELDRLSIDLGKCRKLVDLMRPEENTKKEDIPDSSMLLEVTAFFYSFE